MGEMCHPKAFARRFVTLNAQQIASACSISARLEWILRHGAPMTPIDRFGFMLSGLTAIMLAAAVIWAFVAMLPALAALSGR